MDLIDKNALMRTLGITDMDCSKCKWGDHGQCTRGSDFTDACFAIEYAPTVEERKIGKWIRNDNGTYSCSLCHSWIPEEQHFYARYCLYCGADMRGDET